jgi:hypothetical protein
MPSYNMLLQGLQAALAQENRYCGGLAPIQKERYLESLTEIELLHRVKKSILWQSLQDEHETLLATGNSQRCDLSCRVPRYELDLEAKQFFTNSTRATMREKGIEDWLWINNQHPTKRLDPAVRSVYLAMFPTALPHVFFRSGPRAAGTALGSWAFCDCISGPPGVPPHPDGFKPYWPIACQDPADPDKLVFRRNLGPRRSIMNHNGQNFYVEVVGDHLNDAVWAILVTNRPVIGAYVPVPAAPAYS